MFTNACEIPHASKAPQTKRRLGLTFAAFDLLCYLFFTESSRIPACQLQSISVLPICSRRSYSPGRPKDRPSSAPARTLHFRAAQQRASHKHTRHTSAHPEHRISYRRVSIQYQIHRESSIQHPSRRPHIRPVPYLSRTCYASIRHLATPAPSTTSDDTAHLAQHGRPFYAAQRTF